MYIDDSSAASYAQEAANNAAKENKSLAKRVDELEIIVRQLQRQIDQLNSGFRTDLT